MRDDVRDKQIRPLAEIAGLHVQHAVLKSDVTRVGLLARRCERQNPVAHVLDDGSSSAPVHVVYCAVDVLESEMPTAFDADSGRAVHRANVVPVPQLVVNLLRVRLLARSLRGFRFS